MNCAGLPRSCARNRQDHSLWDGPNIGDVLGADELRIGTRVNHVFRSMTIALGTYNDQSMVDLW